jgi:hypothetical protein
MKASYQKLIPILAKCFCLGLERLIRVKRAAGRPKDFEVIAELEAILDEKKK